MEREVYSYMITTMDLLSKSMLIQDQKNLKLFSYLYNNYADTSEKLQNISYYLENFDQKIQKIEFRLGKIDKKIDKMIGFINENSNANIKVDEPKPSIIKKIYNNICSFFKSIYKYCYNLIFRNKLKKIEEENRIKQEQLEEKKKINQRLAIKKILNNNK